MNRRLSALRVSIAAGAAVGVFASAGTLAGARGAFEAQGNGTAQFRLTRAQRDLLRRGRHGRLDDHGGARVLRRRRRAAGGGPVPAHGAVTHLLGGFDHAGQRADHVGDDDRRQYQPERHRLRRGTEPSDFNHDGDGAGPWTLLELAKARGMKVGVVSTAQITHATPAATYSHINQRNNENDIALQALPTDATYNRRLGGGIDVLMGGGRRFFVPSASIDEEGGTGGRDRQSRPAREFAAAGYSTSGTVPGSTRCSRQPPGARPVRTRSHGVRARPRHRPRR